MASSTLCWTPQPRPEQLCALISNNAMPPRTVLPFAYVVVMNPPQKPRLFYDSTRAVAYAVANHGRVLDLYTLDQTREMGLKVETKKRFPLLELMIIIAIIGILAAVLTPWARKTQPDGTVCKAGYKFVVGGFGRHETMTQVLDSQGRGLPCP